MTTTTRQHCLRVMGCTQRPTPPPVHWCCPTLQMGAQMASIYQLTQLLTAYRCRARWGGQGPFTMYSRLNVMDSCNGVSVFITTYRHLCMIVGKGQRIRRHQMLLCAKCGKLFLSRAYLPAARMIAILCVQSIPPVYLLGSCHLCCWFGIGLY